MTKKSKYNLDELAAIPFSRMAKGQRIAASKAGIIHPVRSDRERQLRTRYNITLEDYDALLALQQGTCAICHKDHRNLLYVDHNHTTGNVRGLLCPSCNTLCGAIESAGHAVYLALAYLSRHESLPSAAFVKAA